MAKKPAKPVINLDAFDNPGARLIEIELAEEMETSFGEYAYSVIHARALPDARDGLKPVHRRIMYGMHEMGLRPDKAYTKAAEVVGKVMGTYHPHGNSAIYESMVRLSQDFQLSAPLVDGQGAWGSPGKPAAAERYTECRMTPVATLLVGDIDEDTVDMKPNYSNKTVEPTVLPAAFPNLLVNGGEGIAVGMTSSMIPHNLAETVAAARHLLAQPDATLDTLMTLLPGPDLPTGGLILGADAVRSAYENGRGVVRIRGRAVITPIPDSRGRHAITFTEMPYGVSVEKVIESIQAEVAGKPITVGAKRGQRQAPGLTGIADVRNTTDVTTDQEQMVVESKPGVNPEALLADLYRKTPLETSFGIINNALVDGTPQELGLIRMLRIFLDHRLEVVTRRTKFRLNKAETTRHLVEGMLVALDNVDKVVKIIRSSSSTAEAHARLLSELGPVRVQLGPSKVARTLDDVQVGHILEMPLRRLVTLEVDSLRKQWVSLTDTINYLKTILDDETVLQGVVDGELAAVAADHGRPRRTTLVDGDLKEALAATAPAAPLEIEDSPCALTLSTSGMLGRFDAPYTPKRARGKHDALRVLLFTSTRATVGVLTSRGRLLHLPVLAVHDAAESKTRGVPVADVVDLEAGERVVSIVSLADDAPMLALATRNGVVKRIAAADFGKKSGQEIIGLKDGDELLAAVELPDDPDAADLVFVTDDAQLLRTPAAGVRPQGRTGGGMAGVKLAEGAAVVAFAAVDAVLADDVKVVTATDGAGVKTTPLSEYPVKGRATGGVRCMRLLKGETVLTAAYVGLVLAVTGVTAAGDLVALPTELARRDAAGMKIDTVLTTIAETR